MKDTIVLTLAVGLVLIMFIIVGGDFYNSLEESRPPDKDVINLLQSAITGVVGIIAGYVVGKKSD